MRKKLPTSWRRFGDGGATGRSPPSCGVIGSAYRKPGRTACSSSATASPSAASASGCIEPRCCLPRWRALIETGVPVVVRYDTTPDEDGRPTYSLGCGGAVDVLIESLASTHGRAGDANARSSPDHTPPGNDRVGYCFNWCTPSALASESMMLDENELVKSNLSIAEMSAGVLNETQLTLMLWN